MIAFWQTASIIAEKN